MHRSPRIGGSGKQHHGQRTRVDDLREHQEAASNAVLASGSQPTKDGIRTSEAETNVMMMPMAAPTAISRAQAWLGSQS